MNPESAIPAGNGTPGTIHAARLPGIAVPTLVMTGEHDAGSTPRMARLIAERIPDCRLHILHGLKHSVLIEAPDRTGRVMTDFLAE